MDEDTLEAELLKAVRRAPDRRAVELAALIGLPRTNWGRSLARRLLPALGHLAAAGFVEERRGRYRLAEPGRRRLAERAANADERG